MRARRPIGVVLVGCALLLVPHEAAADGGAYIDFGGTHYLPGETARGVGYVWIPRDKQDLVDHGPFFVYVLPPGAWIEAGKPIPDAAIRVDTATIEREAGKEFEVRTSFTVPDVPGDYYQVQLCNTPCTIAGFAEPLTATISIVQTEREAELLDEYQALYGKNWSLRRQVRKASKAKEELTTDLTRSRETVTELSAEVARLEDELAGATAPDPVALGASATPADENRPLVDAWALVAIGGATIVALAAIGLALVFGRRSTRRLRLLPISR
jgi:hypothetical protein